jgi:hypothetical protein
MKDIARIQEVRNPEEVNALVEEGGHILHIRDNDNPCDFPVFIIGFTLDSRYLRNRAVPRTA